MQLSHRCAKCPGCFQSNLRRIFPGQRRCLLQKCSLSCWQWKEEPWRANCWSILAVRQRRHLPPPLFSSGASLRRRHCLRYLICLFRNPSQCNYIKASVCSQQMVQIFWSPVIRNISLPIIPVRMVSRPITSFIWMLCTICFSIPIRMPLWSVTGKRMNVLHYAVW